MRDRFARDSHRLGSLARRVCLSSAFQGNELSPKNCFKRRKGINSSLCFFSLKGLEIQVLGAAVKGDRLGVDLGLQLGFPGFLCQCWTFAPRSSSRGRPLVWPEAVPVGAEGRCCCRAGRAAGTLPCLGGDKHESCAAFHLRV